MVIDLFHLIKFTRENSKEMDLPLSPLLNDLEVLLRRHSQDLEIFESLLFEFIYPTSLRPRKFQLSRMGKIFKYMIKKHRESIRRNTAGRIYQESVLPFLTDACENYQMDRRHLEAIIADPRVDIYLKVGFARFLILIQYWGIHHLKQPEEEVLKIIKAAIPGIISVRLIDLATDHADASFCPMLIPLLSMFHREIQKFVGEDFMDAWWPSLAAGQAKSEQDELEAQWKIMPEAFYSNDLLGNKALTTAILLLALLHRSKQMEYSSPYIEITRYLCAYLQIGDDLLDWREDLIVGRISFPLRAAILHEQIDFDQLKKDLKDCPTVESIPEKWERQIHRGIMYSQARVPIYQRMDLILRELHQCTLILEDDYWLFIALVMRVALCFEYQSWLESIRKASSILESKSAELCTQL